MLGNLVVFICLKFRITANLAAENLALRQQLAVIKRTNRYRGKPKNFDNTQIAKNKKNVKAAFTGFMKKVINSRPDFVEHIKKHISTSDPERVIYQCDEDWPLETDIAKGK